jgi:hypothetical protein
MSTPKPTPEELEELVRLIAKTPPRHRYVLVQRASGELAFVQDELDAMLEQAIAAAFGKPRPKRRVIKIDLLSRYSRQPRRPGAQAGRHGRPRDLMRPFCI